ncbi:MAG: ABC transporter permease [Pseudomonadota bacterium]
MTGQGLRACVRKETLLLARDLHGLALLFIMPLAFVLIMSLALQDQFAARAGRKPVVLGIDHDGSEASRALLASLKADAAFDVRNATDDPDDASLRQRLKHGDYAFALTVEKEFGAELGAPPPASRTTPRIGVMVAPDTGKQMEAIFVGSLHAALGRARLRAVLEAVGAPTNDTQSANDIAVRYAYGEAGGGEVPSAVQQSVPGWLVFGMFFVVVPLSNTFIRERQLGTLRRLRSTNLGQGTVLLGKLIPYFVVNQLQVLLMLAAGCWLVPLLGGEALHISGSWLALATIAASLSLAALGLALLIAVVSRTTEQATLLGGTGNILLAALGGIMVPKFVMPETMRHVANFSPMSWGLEGFLDVMLRGGGLGSIVPEASGLVALGLVAILLAGWLHRRHID